MTIRIPVDFSAVEEYEVVGSGNYSAVVEQLLYIEAKAEDKFPQIQVTYTLTEDGETQGRKLSQWLSFSPKALFRMKAWFDAFDVEIDELEIDEESGIITAPDLTGSTVEIKVGVEPSFKDKTQKVNRIDGAPLVHSVPEQRPVKKTRVLPRGASRDEAEDEAPPKKPGARTIR